VNTCSFTGRLGQNFFSVEFGPERTNESHLEPMRAEFVGEWS
jgi:hypothetical protein